MELRHAKILSILPGSPFLPRMKIFSPFSVFCWMKITVLWKSLEGLGFFAFLVVSVVVGFDVVNVVGCRVTSVGLRCLDLGWFVVSFCIRFWVLGFVVEGSWFVRSAVVGLLVADSAILALMVVASVVDSMIVGSDVIVSLVVDSPIVDAMVVVFSVVDSMIVGSDVAVSTVVDSSGRATMGKVSAIQ